MLRRQSKRAGESPVDSLRVESCGGELVTTSEKEKTKGCLQGLEINATGWEKGALASRGEGGKRDLKKCALEGFCFVSVGLCFGQREMLLNGWAIERYNSLRED